MMMACVGHNATCFGGLCVDTPGGNYMTAACSLLKHRLFSVVFVQIMARVGRGALVGLPAVGALFVAHLAHQDWHRLVEERAAGVGGMFPPLHCLPMSCMNKD
jgi:hypothetical protein